MIAQLQLPLNANHVPHKCMPASYVQVQLHAYSVLLDTILILLILEIVHASPAQLDVGLVRALQTAVHVCLGITLIRLPLFALDVYQIVYPATQPLSVFLVLLGFITCLRQEYAQLVMLLNLTVLLV